MKTVIALIVALAIIIGIGPWFHTAYAVGWFFLNDGSIPPQDKAELLGNILSDPSLLNLPALKVYAYSSAAVLASVAFSLMARFSSIFSGAGCAAVLGSCVVFYGGLGVLGISCGVCIFFVALGLHALIRREGHDESSEPPKNILQPTADAPAE